MSFIIHAGLPGTLRGTEAGAAAPGRRGPAFGAGWGEAPLLPPRLLFHAGPIPKALSERDVALSVPLYAACLGLIPQTLHGKSLHVLSGTLSV